MQLKFISTLLVTVGAVMTAATPIGHSISYYTAAIDGFWVNHITDFSVVLYNDICLDVDVCVNLKAKGLVDIDIKAKLEILKLQLKSAIGVSIETTLEADLNNIDIKLQIQNILTDQCGDSKNLKSCLKSNSKIIATNVRKACDSAVLKISDKVKAQLGASVSTAIDVTIDAATINLLVEYITVSGSVDLKAKVFVLIDAWAKLWINDWDKTLVELILQLVAN